MIQPQSFQVVRCTDRSAYLAFQRVSDDLRVQPTQLHATTLLHVQKNQPHQNYSEPAEVTVAPPFGDATGQDRLDQYLALEGCHLATLKCDYGNGASVTFTRTKDGNGRALGNPPDQLSVNPGGLPELDYLKLLDSVRRHFRFTDNALFPHTIQEELSRYYHAREASLQRLEDGITSMTAKLTEYTAGLDARYAEKAARLEADHEAKVRAVAADRAALAAEVEAERKRLAERAKELDDMANAHARRKLYNDLKQIISARTTKFQLSGATAQKRRLVWGVTLTAVALLLGGFVVCLRTNLAAEATNWVAVGTQVGFGLGLAGMVAFLIQWQNNWFASHAREEFKLQRLDLDMHRASWLVELVMEWKQVSGEKDFPPDLMTKLAEGMFSDRPADGDGNPAETLPAGLLGDDGEMTVEPGKFLLKRRRK